MPSPPFVLVDDDADDGVHLSALVRTGHMSGLSYREP
jgi:hypothetical protein